MPQVDYSKTLIYKIQHQTKDELLYVGSTTHFGNRKVRHKNNCNNANGKSYNLKLYSTIRDNGGWDAFNMVIVKEFPCENKRQAEAEEDRIMREMKACLNSHRAYITKEEKKEQMKEYREQNRDKVNEQKKEYYIRNINKIKEKNKEKINCQCGCAVIKYNLARHKRSKKHQEYLNQQTDQ